MDNYGKLKEFYQGKKVLVTGHTGFKGSVMTLFLSSLGAEVFGYALPAPTDPSLFEILYGKESSGESRKNLSLPGEENHVLSESRIADIRDFEALSSYLSEVSPDVIIHMAAQPIVRTSYQIPRETYEVNVMGTVNLLESVRVWNPEKTVSLLNVTTDKVYKNEEREDCAFLETDPLDGFDPYSNSKSCSELLTHSYASSFFGKDSNVRISTARAGNVIGGGDFAKDRLIPDCIRAYMNGEKMKVRNPYSVRPYQHVFEPVLAYLMIAMGQYMNPLKQGSYNVGPDRCDCVSTGTVCDLFMAGAEGFLWENTAEENAPHEAGFLRLDNGKIRKTFGWKPQWHIDEAVAACVSWAKAYRKGEEEAVKELLSRMNAFFGQ